MSGAGRPSRLGIAAVVLLALAVAMLAAQQFGWRQTPRWLPKRVAPGGLYSVTLNNGQVYYGELVEASETSITLEHVYYVQATAAASQPHRLVNRQTNDWHAPTFATILSDKIVMLEEVGKQSTLASLIQQDQAAVKRP